MNANAYVLCLFGICGYPLFWLLGLKLAPPIEANSLNYLWPLFLFILSAKIDKVAVSHAQIFGILCGFIGSVLIFHEGSTYSAYPHYGIGLICSLIGAIIWSVYSSISRVVRYNSDRVGIFLLVSTILSYLLHKVFESNSISEISLVNWMSIIILGCSQVSYIFWDYAMKFGDRQNLSCLSYIVPLVSMSLLALFTQAVWDLRALLGASFIIMGCLIVNVRVIIDILTKRRYA